ncbi:MAG: phospholipid-binding lipoprotein MlaA [Thiomicrorhabdus sp.]|nr:MAG: phospholipid-binding lipoprotein MlaA [Thiomicrorhabdus sp.]
MKFKSKLSILLLSSTLISGQALALEESELPYVPPISDQDPYESFNRVMFDFNMGFNDTVGKPIVNAYTGLIPLPARIGVSNFYDNLTVPLSAINSFLQGNLEDGFSNTMRFIINSTFGLFGLLDIATPGGLEHKREDLGQTLYSWGLWSKTNYIVLPIVGSYTMRELVGSNVDSSYNPIYPHVIDTDLQGRIFMYMSGKFIDYTEIVKFIDDLKNQPDPYIFARESYIQHRTNLLYNGNVPQADLDDFDFD